MLLPSMLLFAALASAAEPRLVQIAPSHGPFVYSASPEEISHCTISARNSIRAEIVSETESHFELRWLTPIGGCYYDRMFGNLSKKQGFVRKSDITWNEGEGEDGAAAEDMPIVASVNKPADAAAVPPAPCPDPSQDRTGSIKEPSVTGSISPPAGNLGSFNRIGNLLHAIKNGTAGIKSNADIDKYMECYPYGDEGRENYQRYKKFLDVAGDTFRVTIKGQPIEVNPTLVACLLRRESGYDPKNTSHTDAVGLGQHTSINIKDMSQRLGKKGSWEGALWKSFFAQVKGDPEGKKILRECRSSAKGGEPKFDSREDAKCPLQSIAASHIYNLVIQRELLRGSKTNNVDWEHELDYQLAVGAAYNLGNGAAREAVEDLFVKGWVKAITRKSSNKEKQKEVANHVAALRNCMQANNWQPMVPKDKPRCNAFPGTFASKKP